MAKIITVYNHKGGSGKSLITVNLAGCLAYMGYRVLHIDMDSQGNSSSRLGFYRNEVNILDALKGVSELPILPTPYSPNLFVAPGSRETELLGYAMHCQGLVYQDVLRDLLAPLENRFHFIIIDTPPSSVSPMVANAFIASTHILVPVDSDGPNALENLDLVLEMFSEMRLINPKLNMLGWVLNRVENDFSSEANESQTISLLKSWNEDPSWLMYKTKIREYKNFQQASWRDMPVIFHSEKSEASKNLLEVAKETVQRLKMKSPKKEPLENIEEVNN